MIIRKYNKGDEHQILKLDRLVETHPWNRRNIDNWYWKYKGLNPFGKSLTWVAQNKKKIVATFSIIPLEYKIKNKVIKGACSIAMIVHPDYQNKGLIKFVADKLFENAKINKIKFIYGYPNDNAYLIHKKFFLYEDISMQRLFHKKMLNKKIYPLLDDIKIKEIKKFDKKINFFLNKVKNQRIMFLNRNSKFLNWRYSQRPDINYKKFSFLNKKNSIIGYIVLKVYHENKIKRGHIVDLYYDINFPKIFEKMVNFSLNYFSRFKCNELTLWIQGDKKASNLLIKNAFKIKSTRPMICKFLNVSRNEKKLMNKKNWYFTMGDTLEIY